MQQKLSRALPRTFQKMHCGVALTVMPITHYADATFPRPVHSFQCSVCRKGALVFPAPFTAIVVWSDEWRGWKSFREFLDEKIARHVEKHRTRERMYVKPNKHKRKKRS